MKAAATSRRTAPVLLIEDEPSVSAFLRAALERRGYSVVPVSSGAEGLDRLSAGDYLGIISDIRMPGRVNGAEVHDWVQQNRPELSTRLILITGDTANRETQALLDNSGTPWIEKPFRVRQFLSIVEKTFGAP
ncbi:MAG TPA: response regulator [Candidatus Acidoferrum sp.]|nr:response regulator [Candidatus Acidoferrum sp.]